MCTRHVPSSHVFILRIRCGQPLDDPGGFENEVWWIGLQQTKQDMIEQRNKFSNYPRDSVSWYQAVAFTRWLSVGLPAQAWPIEVSGTPESSGFGRYSTGSDSNGAWSIRLPTEWEWQQAAMGGNPANEYPWGTDWNNELANTNEAGLGRATAVGMYPQGASLVGALDMAGNVYDWCLNQSDTPQNMDVGGEAHRALRGGAFSYDRKSARSTFRFKLSPIRRNVNVGFRVVCARPPSP